MRSRARVAALAAAAFLTAAAPRPLQAQAQTPEQTPVPPAVESVSFADAVARATARNTATAVAAAAILRAEALLSQTKANNRLQVDAALTTTSLNRGVQFEGISVIPQHQLTAALQARLPLYAPAQWALRARAEDARNVANYSAVDIRRQTALATADAYLAVVARRRVVESNVRARDTARAHYELARDLEAAGAGSRLNMLRAQQELSSDEGLVEAATMAVYRAQEALGVLMMADGPVDTAEDPDFSLPEDRAPDPTNVMLLNRTDLKLFSARQEASERIVRDSRKDYFPRLDMTVQTQSLLPSQAFAQQNSGRFILQLAVPLWDSGLRKAQKLERQANLNVAMADLAGATTQASSEVRTARAAVGSAERALASVRSASAQAQEVVNITNISFSAGGATNIEVIDAERRARDTDNAVAVAEDAVRRARLDLRDALGLFP